MNNGLRQSVSLGYIISAAFFFIVAVLVPNTALADGLNLYTVDNFTMGTLKSTDQTGTESKTDIETINQLYNIYMGKTLFPNLTLDAGGLFGRINSVVKDGEDVHSATNQYNVFTDIKLDAKPFSSSLGYYKRVDSSKALGTTSATIEDRYNFLFDWRPDPELPSLEINYTKDFSHDGRRLVSDFSSDQLLVGARYDPFKSVGLTYDLNYIDQFDNLQGIETVINENSGRLTYTDRFFKNRVSVDATYDIASENIDTIGRKNVKNTAVQLQLFPVHGLSGISDITTANTPAMITLNENPALIDGSMTGSAGINLGLNSGLVTVPAPPRQEWNIGLDFVTPTQLTSLFIWVDKDLTKISDLFKWDIYTSDDNITWTKKFSVTVAPSDFSTLPLPHFNIHFPSAITSRFVKAVVKPLDSVDQTTIIVRGLTPSSFNDIAVTELQAFILKTSSSSNQNTASQSELSQHLSLNARAKLLESRNLFYNLSLFLAREDPAALTTAFISNGLTFAQKFGGIYTFSAMAARNDNYLPNGHGVEYQYTAAINATPFATLSDSLLYSGHRTTNPTGTTNISNSFFLYNTAILYPGINGLLNGGVTFGTLETGQSNESLQGNASLTLVPNPRTSLNVTYTIGSSSLSGGNKRPSSFTTYAALASATYTPVNSLYLFASIQLSKSTILQTTTNYGLNFSPFPGGELQFHFSYDETLGPETNEKSRTISPSLRWNIRPGATLDLTYQIQQSNLVSQTSDSRILTSSLQVAL